MKINEIYKIRSVADQSVIILQGRHGVDTTKVLSLNDTSLWLWERFSGGLNFTLGDVQVALVEHYGVDEELARRDAEAWVEMLSKYDVIIEL